MEINLKILDWYDKNKRDLPWRETSDPYKIWLSEVILQQTRVDQGLDYYLTFIEKFPSVRDLAVAHVDTVLKFWQGLGYYSRARNLQTTAKIIAEKMNGIFPGNYIDLLKLPGIGPYTAAAISSIAFGEPRPVVDGNVLRVISRWFAIDDPVNSSKGKEKVSAVMEQLIVRQQPGKFNQAVMEFGATFCKPGKPDCESCPFKENCLAFQTDAVTRYPVKTGKASRRIRHFHYIILYVTTNGETATFIRKRRGKDIWQGLYEFPLFESGESVSIGQLMQHIGWNTLTHGSPFNVRHTSQQYRHQLTHQELFARFWEIECSEIPKSVSNDFQLVLLKDIKSYPVPRLIEKYLTGRKIL